MDKKIDTLIPVLQELKSDTMLAGGNPENIMEKYHIPFFGPNCNIISTIDLHCVLTNYFHISIEMGELHALIPSICSALSMKYNPMSEIGDMSNPDPNIYQIELW